MRRWALLRSCHRPQVSKQKDHRKQGQNYSPVRNKYLQQGGPHGLGRIRSAQLLKIDGSPGVLLGAVPTSARRNKLLPFGLGLRQQFLQIQSLRGSQRRHGQRQGQHHHQNSSNPKHVVWMPLSGGSCRNDRIALPWGKREMSDYPQPLAGWRARRVAHESCGLGESTSPDAVN